MTRTSLALLALSLLTGAAPPEAKKTLDLYFIDADGGAATLIVSPAGESILIDSGWPGLEDRDPKRIVHVLKDVAGLDHLDHLVTTHWHTDHYGGVAGLAKLIPIDHYWDRGLPGVDGPASEFPDGPKPDDPLGVAYIAASKGKRKALEAGDTIPLKGDLKALVVASGGVVRHIGKRQPTNALAKEVPPNLPEDKSDNARSLAIKFTLGRFGFLDCGDLTWNVEKDLAVPYDRVGPVDVYQVTHHGMDISNHPTLVRTIAPTVAIMNNGPTKGGAPGTVKLLKSIPSIKAAYQLHKNAKTGPDDNTDPSLIANADPKGGQFVHVSVAPGGKTYTVQIGEDGAKREFATK
jgi:competence protein ComEC